MILAPPSASELLSFLALDPDACAAAARDGRPYTWSNTLQTLDGVISLGADQVQPLPLGGLLQRVDPVGAEADWRLLNAGWSVADAVVTTGETLRSEPHTVYTTRFGELAAHRRALRKAPPFAEHPLQVIVTRSGDLDFAHGVFWYPGLHCAVLTTTSGAASCRAKIEAAATAAAAAAAGSSADATAMNPVDIVVCETPGQHGVDLRAAVRLIRRDYGVQLLELDGGGLLLSQCIREGLVDEMRVTLCGLVVGNVDSRRQPRATLFPHGLLSFVPGGAMPRLRFLGVRPASEGVLFLRMRLTLDPIPASKL